MSLLRPSSQAAAHRVSLKARGTEGLGGHLRAGADAAVEDDRPVALDGRGLGGELDQRDVACARDVPGLALVGLAHVDHLRGGILCEPCLYALGVDLEWGSLYGHWASA